MLEHSNGRSFATRSRLPFSLVYFEGCVNMEDTKRRERYLKTTQGKRFLGLRLQLHNNRKRTAMGSVESQSNPTEIRVGR